MWRATSHVVVVDTPPIARPNPAAHPPPTMSSLPPKMGPPTSNTQSLPSSTQMPTELRIRAERRLSNQMGRSCTALPCPRSVSNRIASPSHLPSSSLQKDLRNRILAARARACVRTHIPTPRQIGSSPSRFVFPLTEVWTPSVLSTGVNGVRSPRANDGGRMPLGDQSKRTDRRIWRY